MEAMEQVIGTLIGVLGPINSIIISYLTKDAKIIQVATLLGARHNKLCAGKCLLVTKLNLHPDLIKANHPITRLPNS